MVNFEKIVKVTDTVLDCIPIVSSISNAAQAMYKLAHKVDALNPVAPGLKTSIKIHVLSKENLRCFVCAIPILGNISVLLELILKAIMGLDLDDDDHFMKAVCSSNKEVVHLCLGNNALNDPQRADSIFSQAAHSSNHAVFKQVLDHREDWSAKSLMKALMSCWFAVGDRVANAHSILDYWQAHGKVLEVGEIYSGTSILKDFLKKGREDLAARVIEILPQGFDFRYIEEILLLYSCCQFDSSGKKETVVLTEENRNALIAKSEKPSLEDLEKYFISIGDALKKGSVTAENYRKVHFSTFNKLLDLAKLQPHEMGKFITSALSYDELDFLEPLIAKNEDQLSAEWKRKILNQLLPSAKPNIAIEQRVQLFEAFIGWWKNTISAEAPKLYTDISENAEFQIEESQLRFDSFPDAIGNYPSIKSLEVAHRRCQDILVREFPGCDNLLFV